MPMPTLSRVCVVCAFLLSGALGARALAQPVAPADLRREIERLQAENLRLATQVQTLTTKLAEAETARDAASRRAEDLAQAVERMRVDLQRRTDQVGELTPRGQTPPTLDPQPATHAPVPEDPMAAPASLLAELQERYQAAFGADAPSGAMTAAQRKAIDEWCVEQGRTLRGPVEWRVRLSDLREVRRNERSVLMTVVDPASGLPIGDTLEVAVPRAFADRVARELGVERGPEKAPMWTLVGTLTAAPKLNADRPTPGVFNHPAFVGAFVEFGFDLDWKSATVLQMPAAPAAPAATSSTVGAPTPGS